MNKKQFNILLGLIKNPKSLIKLIFINYITYLIPDDERYLKMVYRLYMGRKLNLENPLYFQEKIQWLKLYDKHNEYTMMVDKYDAKNYVKSKIGEDFIIPTLGVWNNVEDIDFDNLPNQFVLKCTHDSGKVIICKDKSSLNFTWAKNRLRKSSHKTFWKRFREYPYSKVKPRIIAERLLSATNSNDLVDYKFYCFNGEPIYCQVIKDRSTVETIDFYDMEWTLQEFVGLNKKAKNAKIATPKPINIDVMIDICRKLSSNIPFVRIDLYNIEGKIYFGEITFFPRGGVGFFTPSVWNRKLGDLIKLPPKHI